MASGVWPVTAGVVTATSAKVEHAVPLHACTWYRYAVDAVSPASL